MSRTLVDCGCQARVHSDGSGVEIDFCDLHEHAEALQKAVSGLLELVEAQNIFPERYVRNARRALRESKGLLR